MHLILCHIGNDFPSHFIDCIEQTKKFYDGNITIISNSNNIEIFKKYNVEIYHPNFENEKFKHLENFNFPDYGDRNFWVNSLARVFFIEDYVVEKNINNFFTYDNDVLIYSDLKSVILKISELYENIAITVVDDIGAVFGFCYFKNKNDIIRLNQDIIEILNDNNKITKINFLNEMSLIGDILKNKNYIKQLPSLPTDNYYDEFGFVFDPAGYGQFLGGTPAIHGYEENYINPNSYIGKELLNNKYKVFFNYEYGPYIVNNENTIIKIFNLHVWSKNLIKFRQNKK